MESHECRQSYFLSFNGPLNDTSDMTAVKEQLTKQLTRSLEKRHDMNAIFL
jgi:hypothetical protein